jgi:ABC-type sugar transport system ATPase subunit
MGAGRSELCECLFGIHPNAVTGEVFLCGKPIRLHSPRDAIRHGVSFATEDRKGQGLVLQRSIGENMSLPLLKLFSRFGFMQTRREKVRWEEERERLTIKAPNCQTLAGALSGGNQQKVILGRWLLTSPKLLILDEPTRGIDVGAKAEIYQLIDELAHSGMAILVVSSEMPELIGLSDRIVALCEGHKTAEFKRGEVTQEQLLRAATRTEDTTHA